jgi:hypothetical protein
LMQRMAQQQVYATKWVLGAACCSQMMGWPRRIGNRAIGVLFQHSPRYTEENNCKCESLRDSNQVPPGPVCAAAPSHSDLSSFRWNNWGHFAAFAWGILHADLVPFRPVKMPFYSKASQVSD